MHGEPAGYDFGDEGPRTPLRHGGRLGGHGGGWHIGIDVTIELAPGEVYQPDLPGWRIERMPVLSDEWPVRTVPDWVCEILSPSTAGRDLGHKLQTYHRAGVGHYWVADPGNHVLSVYRWQEGIYGLALAASASDVVHAEPFDAIELDLGRIFGVFPKE